jgi:bifunctional non-homologous end joining protein LigD
MIVRRPSGFIEPCLPSKATQPPPGPLWVHEIKHDGYRVMVAGMAHGSGASPATATTRRTASRPSLMPPSASTSFLIDGEAVVVSDDGRPDFHALRSKRSRY